MTDEHLSAGRSRGEETQEFILAAAEPIFADAGFAGARTEAIARAAKVNKALLYYYFGSKAGLFRAVLENHLREFHRQAIAILASDGSARDLLTSYVSTHFDFISARPNYPRLFQRLIMTGGKTLDRLVKAYLMPVSRKLKQVIERGQRQGELRVTDSHHTAISLAALTVFYFTAAPVVKLISRTDPYRAANLAHRKREVLSFIRYGLFANRRLDERE